MQAESGRWSRSSLQQILIINDVNSQRDKQMFVETGRWEISALAKKKQTNKQRQAHVI